MRKLMEGSIAGLIQLQWNAINFLYLTSSIFKTLVIVDVFYDCQIKSYVHGGRDGFVNFNNICPSLKHCQQQEVPRSWKLV